MHLKHLRLANVLYFLYLIDISISVPPLYCLHPLNSSDCKGKPTPVFSYYKPGSRCEIETWRGCPTFNKFDDEYQCSHFCIFNFLERFLDEPPMDSNRGNVTCHRIFNGSKCTNQTVSVYTYDKTLKKCEPATWRGCKTDNKFDDESTCISTCSPDAKPSLTIDKLKYLQPDDAKKIDSILNTILMEDRVENETTILKQTPSNIEDSTPNIPEETNTTNADLTTPDSTIESTTLAVTTPGTDETTVETNTELNKEDPTGEITTETVESTTHIMPSGTVEEVVLPDDK